MQNGTRTELDRSKLNGVPYSAVVGLGDPIMDVLIPLSHGSFDKLGLQRGGSTPLDSEAITQLLEQIGRTTPRTE